MVTISNDDNRVSEQPANDPIAVALNRIANLMEAHWRVDTTEHDRHDAAATLEQIIATSPIKPLLDDDDITDIMINGPFEVYVAHENEMKKTDITFPDKRSLHQFAKAIAESVGRSIDSDRPLVDARLKDGSRVNIIAPPLAVNGLTLSIRKFSKRDITLQALVEKTEMNAQMARFLAHCAQCRVSMIISGGTGTGKTTLLNAISHYIPEKERIITIEDTVELRLQQSHVVQLETKVPHTMGAHYEEVTTADLVHNALRMRPDRIIIGEIRGPEAFDMIQAMNTGHDGSMTTVHANSPRDALARLQNLISPAMANVPVLSIRQQIVSAVKMIIQLAYLPDGRRVVSSITELVGMEGDVPTMQELFSLRKQPPNAPQTIQQDWTNIIPHHPRLAEAIRNDPDFLRK